MTLYKKNSMQLVGDEFFQFVHTQRNMVFRLEITS